MSGSEELMLNLILKGILLLKSILLWILTGINIGEE